MISPLASAFDQRGTGFARIRDGNGDGLPVVDIGASELQSGAIGNAFASISGKVSSPNGSGLRNASVTLTDNQGVTRTVTTSSFGFYAFDNVAAGSSYTIAVSSRRYRYAPRSLQIDGSLANVDFVGLE